MTAVAMMMLTFAAAPSAGTWAPNGGPALAQTFDAAPAAWTAPPWIPVPYIMAAQEGGGPPPAVPQLMLMGLGL